MASKSSSVMIMVLVLVCAIATTAPKAEAQGLPGLGGGVSNLTRGLIRITGNVTCSANATVNGTSTPPFSNATVVLRCGGLTLAITVTNDDGLFTFNFISIFGRIRLLLGGCRVVVTTPLATCNASLPTNGTLVAPITPSPVGTGSSGGNTGGFLESLSVTRLNTNLLAGNDDSYIYLGTDNPDSILIVTFDTTLDFGVNSIKDLGTDVDPTIDFATGGFEYDLKI